MSERTWRSAPRIPPLPDPAAAKFPEDPLGRLALGGAWRTRAFGHALAHGLRRAPAPAQHAVVERIAACLRASDGFLVACRSAGLAGAEDLLAARLVREPLPLVESWAELGVADALFGEALGAAAAGLRGSSDAALAAAAQAALPPGFGSRVLDETCNDRRNRPCVQLLVDRWMPAALEVFGRPGTPGDEQLAARGVKPVRSAELADRFLSAALPRLEAWGLEIPDPLRMGLVLPSSRATARNERRSSEGEEKA